MDKQKNKTKWLKWCGWLVYFIWHLIYVIVAVALILPYVTLPVINSVRIDAAPYHYAAYTSIVVALPFFSLLLVFFRFRKDVAAALKLFYGVELPLMLLLLLRVFLFRDAQFAAQLALFHIGIGIAGYFAMLWYPANPADKAGKYLDITLSTIVALVGVYLGLLLGISFFPTACFMLEGLWQNLLNIDWSVLADFLKHLVSNPLSTLSVVLFFITAVFFFTTPLVLIFSYLHQFFLRFRATSPLMIAVVLLVVAFESLVFTMISKQPQLEAFNLTEETPVDPYGQRLLVKKAGSIKKGLLNAYLAPYRFVSTTGTSRSLKKSYTEIFGEKSIIADFAQNVFTTLASPFLYQGEDFEKDKKLAADRYSQFFDTPIEKGERETILAAVKATWENEENQAGLMNAASHYVYLKEQSIKVTEHDDLATVTITQSLENQTYRPQEVLFHFSLPEDAVITGLWMSDDIGNPEKFPHVVSPRGAAQSVYKAEVSRRIDPALLEKVGPLQYRLRAFPIPARVVETGKKQNRYSDTFRDYTVAPVSVQFQYLVSIDDQGCWPLPELLEKRNVYWDRKTVRSFEPESQKDWLPTALKPSQPKVPKIHTAVVNNKVIRAVPRDARQPASILPGPIAVLIDGSFSMNRVQLRLLEQLEWLQGAGIDHELFFCRERCEKIEIHDLDDLVHFGDSQLLKQLSDWNDNQKTDTKDYSSVFVLTDAGSYELSPDKEKTLHSPAKPLWLIHLSEKLPYAYDDAVIDAVNDSDGGIARTLSEAVEMFSWKQQTGQTVNEDQLIEVSKKFFWYLADETTAEPDLTGFATMAAGHLIERLAANSDKNRLKELDRIHAIARQYDIVSFYSSMLVLVEDRQRELLEKAEARDDRFEREIETGAENLTKPMDPFAVPGVPEPEEWALLLIGSGLLLSAYFRKRYSPQTRLTETTSF